LHLLLFGGRWLVSKGNFLNTEKIALFVYPLFGLFSLGLSLVVAGLRLLLLLLD